MFFRNKFYDILKIRDHKINKEKILNQISLVQRPYTNISTESETNWSKISNTDWEMNKTFNWFSVAFSERDKKRIKQHVCKKLNCNQMDVCENWFNQYCPNSGSEHDFHNHLGSNIVAVYFVELTHKSLRLILKDPITGKEIIPKTKEGDIIIFPPHILHKSPKNYTNTRKTSIAFNIKSVL